MKIFIFVILLSSFVFASIESHVNLMLKDEQNISLYKDAKLGRTVISIGLSSVSNKNQARDISRQEAMKYLTGYLKGEKISATDVAEMKYVGNLAEESYYSSIKSSINGSLESAYLYKSGTSSRGTYSVIIISENSNDMKNYFNNMNKKRANIIESKAFVLIEKDKSKARQNAINEALRNAIEQYNGVQIASKTSIENAETYKGKLSSVSKGMVKRYEIKEEYTEKNTYVVIIVAEIVEEDPNSKKSIDAIKENMGRPSFFIDTNDSRLKDMLEVSLNENNLDISSNKDSAKYLILTGVKKYEYDVPRLKGMKGLQTTIKITVKDKYANEEIINISNNPESSVEISKYEEIRNRNSYNYAFEEIKQTFIKNINKHFINKFNNGNKVKIKLVNFDRMRDVNELKDCIDSVNLVKSVSVLPVNNNSVSYEIIYLGNPSDLQLEILKKSKEFRLRGLRIKDSNSSEIIFKF